MSERKLATVETIVTLLPITGADSIEVAKIRGWDVVVKKGEFKAGDLCVYIEVDSLVKVDDPRFEFLSGRGVRSDADGNEGHVLKTAKLRGQYSQGLAMPLSDFPEIVTPTPGEDVTELLGVVRWNPPLPAELLGRVNGRLPGWIPATFEERIENNGELLELRDVPWVATEKIDGTSTTIYLDPSAGDPADQDPANWLGVKGVCSRNYDLTYNPDQKQWKLALELGLHDKINQTWPGQQVALQGETVGEGIPGNSLKLKGLHFALFTVRVDGKELPRDEWPAWALSIAVPTYDLEFPATVEEAVEQANGIKSAYAPGQAAEGVVWRTRTLSHIPDRDGNTRRGSFKAISRKYLLKHDL